MLKQCALCRRFFGTSQSKQQCCSRRCARMLARRADLNSGNVFTCGYCGMAFESKGALGGHVSLKRRLSTGHSKTDPKIFNGFIGPLLVKA